MCVCVYEKLFNRFHALACLFFQVEDKRVKSPNEQAAEKLRQKKLQEESDLKLAKEAFGKHFILVLLVFQFTI